MRAKCCLFFIVFCMLAAIRGYAQYSITVPSSTDSMRTCGVSKSFSITVSTGAETNYKIELPQGVRISTITSASSGVTFPGFNTNNSFCTVDATSASLPYTIDFTARAGCDAISGSTSTLSMPVNIKDSSNVLIASSSSNFNVVNSSGNLIPQTTLNTVYSNINKSVVRTLIFQNTSPANTFSGYIKFSDSHGTALFIDSITINGDAVSNGVATPITVAPNGYVTIVETLNVIECLESNGNLYGNQNILVEYGCTPSNLCIPYPFSSPVRKDGDMSVISFQREESTNIDHFYKCFGAAPEARTVVYKNTGTISLNNLTFQFNANHHNPPIVKDVRNFEVTIKTPLSGGGFTTKSYLVNSAGNQPSSLPPAHVTYGDNHSLDYKDVVYTTSDITNFSIKYNVPLGLTPSFVSRFIINKLTEIGVGTQLPSITLAPNEIIEISWEDRNVCFVDTNFEQKQFYQPSIVVFALDHCVGGLTKISDEFGSGTTKNFVAKHSIMPYAGTVLADQDFCRNTLDGKIESHESNIIFFDINTGDSNPENIENWGDIRFRLDIKSGLDLDLSLGGAALSASYSGQCASSCSTSCSEPTFPSADRYQIVMKSPLFTTDWEPSSIYDATNGRYEINFSLQFLLDSILDLDDEESPAWGLFTNSCAGSMNRNLNCVINTILRQCRIQYKLRSYCTGLATTKVTESWYYVPSSNYCGTADCAIPLTKDDYDVIVNCPGCTVPGTNVSSATFYRKDNFLGLKDEVNQNGQNIPDGIPDSTNRIDDPILKSIATNGDEMVSTIEVFLSNGEDIEGVLEDSIPGGFTLAQMEDTTGLYLDNLYVALGFPSNMVTYLSGTAQVSLDNQNYFNVESVSWQDSTCYIRVKMSNLNDSLDNLGPDQDNFHAIVNQSIFIRSEYKINNSPGLTGYDPDSKTVKILARMSDCDTCEGANLNFLDRAGELATIPQTNAIRGDSTDGYSNMFYLCQTAQSKFSFVPSTSARRTSSKDFSCDKHISIGEKTLTVIDPDGAWNNNAFPREYRSFWAGRTHTYSMIIPLDYTIVGASITNVRDDYLSLEDIYTIQNPQQYVSNNVFTIPLTYTNMPADSSLTSASYQYNSGTLIITGNTYNSTFINLILRPVDCDFGDIDFTGYYEGDKRTDFTSHDQITTLPQIIYPDTKLPNLTNTTVNVKEDGHRVMGIYNPKARVLANYLNGRNFSASEFIFIPIEINNLSPVDSNGNPVLTFEGGIVPSIPAKFPYLYFDNYTELSQKGFEIIGVYEGDRSTIPASNNFYLANTGLAHLKDSTANGLREFLPANSTTLYTIILQYNCAEGACGKDSVYVSCEASSYPGCLTELKQLHIAYGWNCNNYPTVSDITNNSYCDMKTIVNNQNQPSYAEISTLPVSLTQVATISYGIGNTAANLCTEMEYALELTSCQQGNITDVDLAVSLPSGMEWVQVSLVNASNDSIPLSIPAILNGEYLFSDLLISANMFNNFNSGKKVKFIARLKIRTDDRTSKSISARINGSSYCATFEERLINTPITIVSALTNVESQYCIHETPTILIPEASGCTNCFYDGTGIQDNLDGTATFDPSEAGLGELDVIYTIPSSDSVCTAIYHVIVYDVVTVSIIPPTNSAPFLCTGSSGVPLVANVDPAGTFNYIWHYSESNDPFNYGPLSDTSNTHNATLAGFYKVSANMDSSGCTSNEAVYEVVNDIIVDSIIPVCRGDNPSIKLLSTASGNPVLGTYQAQWYRLSDDSLMSDGIPAEGDYYAVAISNISSPSCTLSTVSMPSHITIKQTPQPYEIIFGGNLPGNYVLHCPVGSSGIGLLVVDASVNSSYNNPTKIIWNNQSQTTYTNGIPDSIIVNYGGTFSLTVQDTETGCTAQSNELHIGIPQISVYPSCGSNGTDINLNVYANYPTTGTSYTWKKVTNPGASPTIDTLGDGSVKTVSEADRLYTVESSFLNCPTGDGFYLPLTIPFNVGTSNNGIDYGNFVTLGDSSCNIDFATDFLCQTDKNADPLDKIGHFMINGAADANGASLWNPYWTGTAHNSSSDSTGNEFMLVDGSQAAGDQLVWRREVPVEHAYRYFARASLRNLAIEDQTPIREIPEIWMHVIYKGQSVSHLYTSQGQIIQTTSVGIDPWIEFGTFAVADVKHNASPATKGEAEIVEISIFMKGRGAIGRDVGVDDVELWPVGLCDNLTTVVPTSPCSGISVADPNLLVCPGGQATVTVNNPNPGVTYDYYEIGEDPSTSQSAALDASNSFLAPVISGTFQSYTLAVSGAGCTTKLSFNVRAIDPPQLTIVSVADSNSCNNTKFKVLVNGSEDNNRSYIWKINNGSPESETSLLFTSSTLINGDILSCSIANYNQCGDTTSPVKSYTISSNTFTANAGTDQTICRGDTATIGQAAVSGRVYEWRIAYTTQPNPNPVVSISAQPELSPTTTTNYELTVTNTTSGCSSKDDVAVTVNSLPIVSAGNDQTVCSGTSVTLSGSAAQSYTWDNSVTNGVSFIPTSTTTYTVTGTDANGCQNTDNVLVTIKPLPTITGTTPGARCGTGSLTLAATASAGDIKWYSVLTGGTLLHTGDSYTTPSISTTTTYYVEALLDGCSSAPRTEVVATIGTTTPTITSAPQVTRCFDGEVTLTATASISGSTINWYSNGPTGGTPVHSSLSTSSFTTPFLTSTRPYWVEATLNGCTTTTRTQVLAFLAEPEILTTTPASRCGTGTVTLQATGNGGLYWYLASSGGSYVYVSGSPSSYITPSISSTTSYYVEASHSGCSSQRQEVVATVHPTPSVGVTDVNNTYNCGTNTYSLTATETPVLGSTTNFKWYDYPYTGALLSSGATYSPSISSKTSYLVRWENVSTGCMSDLTRVYLHNKCKGLEFNNGSGGLEEDLVKINTPVTGLMSDGSTAFTYEIFFTPYSGSTNPLNKVALISNRETGDGMTIGLLAGMPYVRVNTTEYVVTNGSAISNNTCHHLAVTRSASPGNILKIYLDGVERYSGTMSTGPTVNLAIRFGKDLAASTNAYNQFKGIIEEVRIWNKALTATEMSNYVNKNVMVNSDLRAVWMMMEGSGQVISEAKNSANDGTLGGNNTVEANDPVWVNYSCTSYMREGYENSEKKNNNENILKVNVVPNPFTEGTYITVTGCKSEYVRIFIIDVNGKQVYENDLFPSNQSVAIGDKLSAGMYLLKVMDGEKTLSEKLLKFR